jgi:hypothetical protein
MPNVDVRPITKDELPQVKDWIHNKHYIGAWPTGVRYKMGIYVDGKLVGALLYGNTLYPKSGTSLFRDESDQPIMQNNQVVELLRAYTTDEVKDQVPNLGSMVVAKGNDYLRKQGETTDGKPIRAILSYADPEAGHSGSVYKATNAAYLGPQRPGKVLVIEDPKTGEKKEKHNMSLKWLGGGSLEKLKKHPKLQGKNIYYRKTSGKHKFMWVMGKDQKERDRLLALLVPSLMSYPKPGEEPHEIPNEAKKKAQQRATQTQQQKKKKKEPESRRAYIKKILNGRVKNPETGNKILVRTALGYDKDHPAHRTALGMVNAMAKKKGIRLKKSRQL